MPLIVKQKAFTNVKRGKSQLECVLITFIVTIIFVIIDTYITHVIVIILETKKKDEIFDR